MFNSSNFNQNDFNSCKYKSAGIKKHKYKKYLERRPNVHLVELLLSVVGRKKLTIELLTTVIGIKKLITKIKIFIIGAILQKIKSLMTMLGNTKNIVNKIFSIESFKLSNINKQASLSGSKISQTIRTFRLCSKLFRNVDCLATMVALKQLSIDKQCNLYGCKSKIVYGINKLNGSKKKYNMNKVDINGRRDLRKIVLALLDID